MADRPNVLIENWFPFETVGAESMRERGASSALPPLYFLHVWWARRPLTVSRAAILASVLPAWSAEWSEPLRTKFPTEKSYQQWFLRACGIFGDPVLGRRLLDMARGQGRTIPNPYNSPRSFTVNPDQDTLDTVQTLLELAWGSPSLAVLDPFAGGGSIPFEALRYGFTAVANELNPVASVILKATLEYPQVYGPELTGDIARYGQMLSEMMQKRLRPFFGNVDEGIARVDGAAFIWARTVACPYTGKLVPLSPNWWLQKGGDPVAVRPLFHDAAREASFEIVRGKEACARANPDAGTVKRGNGISPWAQNQPIDGDYIKAEAQAGRMGQQLYAVALKRKGGFVFRTPTAADVAAVAAAESELDKKLPSWEAKGWVPREPYPRVSNDARPLHYGMPTWGDFFSPRQLLSMCTLLEAYHEVAESVRHGLSEERAKAVLTYLAFVVDKSADYSSRLCKWDGTRTKVTNTFDRHDFSFKWSHAEMDASRNLVSWTVSQVVDAYEGIAKLVSAEGERCVASQVSPATVMNGSAADLATVEDVSIDHICVDPPYEANVMYAECSDFFYVWQKRTLGAVYPDLFRDELTNKDDETVANLARFAEMGRKRKELALGDYRHKMTAAFKEMRRVLRDDGVLTVMFTNKRVEAWDTLASSLINGGFSIASSWPVHTESEHSLHQAKKNAARSTILLSCRKRPAEGKPVWWDDIKDRVRRTARERAREFEAQGVRGVDLYIATFGPTLSILSENWPVLTSEADESGNPKPLRPEVALDLAREEVVALRKQGLLLGRDVQFDPATDWYLMAWDAFGAEQFPADEAVKLALALGVDLESEVISEKRLVEKKGEDVILLEPAKRRRAGLVDPDNRVFSCWLDATQTAMLLYLEDGSDACKRFLNDAGLMNDSTFKACLQAMLNAIPRVTQRGEFVRKEAAALDSMRLAFFPDLEVPPEQVPEQVAEQMHLLGE